MDVTKNVNFNAKADVTKISMAPDISTLGKEDTEKEVAVVDILQENMDTYQNCKNGGSGKTVTYGIDDNPPVTWNASRNAI